MVMADTDTDIGGCYGVCIRLAFTEAEPHAAGRANRLKYEGNAVCNADYLSVDVL